MSGYRLFGAETSPYSIKVRAFLRYKNARFDWIPRSRETEAEFKNFASVPTVPLLLSPDGSANQDSTDIIATLEADHPKPSAVPDGPACQAIALILEDYADEWLNKCMFHLRWGQSPDREAAAQRVLHQLYNGKPPAKKKEAQDKIVARMGEQFAECWRKPGQCTCIDHLLSAICRIARYAFVEESVSVWRASKCGRFCAGRSVSPIARRPDFLRISVRPSPFCCCLEHVHGCAESWCPFQTA